MKAGGEQTRRKNKARRREVRGTEVRDERLTDEGCGERAVGWMEVVGQRWRTGWTGDRER